ncbi:MAG: VTT domain-containing protein [Chloroflexi bacterium]|nr:VTT domain-containing protein [Chloroflexota bacterium]
MSRIDPQVGRWVAGAVVVLALLVVVGVYLWRSGTRPTHLAALGYPGVFLVMILSGASVFFPAPGQATILAAGALWDPILVGMAAGLGNAVGELTGYIAGRAGGAMLGGRKPPHWWIWLRDRLDRYGFFAILVLAMIPNPVFDAVGILAGSVNYPIRRFWMAVAIGNSIKYIGVAYLGEAAFWWLN